MTELLRLRKLLINPYSSQIVLALKKTFEQKYTNGYMLTKRFVLAPVNKDKDFIFDLSNLGKYLMAWQSLKQGLIQTNNQPLL